MKVPVKILFSAGAAVAAAASISACGSAGIKLAKSNPNYHGALIFQEHCSGCHTLSTVGSAGSASSVLDRVKTNAPNFDYRPETVSQVLYALRNGGFSGEVMPQNIVVGKQAEEVARFLAKYAGLEKPKELGESGPEGEEGNESEGEYGTEGEEGEPGESEYGGEAEK